VGRRESEWGGEKRICVGRGGENLTVVGRRKSEWGGEAIPNDRSEKCKKVTTGSKVHKRCGSMAGHDN